MNYFEQVIRLVFPEWAARRAHARYITQSYDAARRSNVDDWTSARNSSADAEVDRAKEILTSRSRDLIRNNPYANKALNVICSNTIGAGIVPTINGRNGTQEKKIKAFFDETVNTIEFDFYGKFDFYSQQNVGLKSAVEGGECFVIRRFRQGRLCIQLLESEFLNTNIDNGPSGNTHKGIEYDDQGIPSAYHIYVKHPDQDVFQKSIRIPAKDVIHLYRPDRIGQSRGVPWSHPCIEALKDLGDFQYSTLVKQKVSACLVGVLTSNSESNLPPEVLEKRRNEKLMMQPGHMFRANPGEDVKFSTPPTSTGYSEFVRENLRAIAAGYGISYESLSGDYSQTSFSSGRLGHHEFRRNIESWRWNFFIPMFCDKIFIWFKDYAKLKGYDVEGLKVDWVPPAYVMIDPTKEIAAEKEAVKAGFKSRSRVIRELGDNPDLVREEILKEKQADDEAGLKFDVSVSDPLDTGAMVNKEGQQNNPNEDKSKKKAE